MKKLVSFALILSLMLSLSSFSAFASVGDNTYEPLLGGGDSHYYTYTNGVCTLSRSEVNNYYVEQTNTGDIKQKVLITIGHLASYIHCTLDDAIGMITPIEISNASKLGSALRNNAGKNTFKIYFKEFQSEVPGAGYIEITKILAY